MRFLILGGTAWLGAQVAATALEAGHEVVCLARGESGAVPAGASLVRADRDDPGAYDELADRTWDVVIDVARQPGHVRHAVKALQDKANLYVFVSSGNVYAEHREPGRDETDPLRPALDSDVMASMEIYGEAKVACEQHVLAAFGGQRTLIVRAGLIGGPGDIFDRSGYWPLRFARNAESPVLVPDAPAELTQVIDVRDLAQWLVTAQITGIFNAGGETVTFAEHLETARAVAGHRGQLVAASPRWLKDHDVEPWAGPRSLPLWLADPDWAGFNARDSSAARSAGLRTRPLAETLADTLTWELSRPANHVRKAGLSDADERALLETFAQEENQPRIASTRE